MSHSYTFRTILSAFVLVALLAGYSGIASAQNSGKSQKIPITFEFNPCDFELIDATGSANIVQLQKEDEDGCIQAKFHVNYQNVTGVGQTTGKNYRIVYTANQSVIDVIACDGCTATITIMANWKLFDDNGKVYSGHTQVVLEIDVCTMQFTVISNKSFSDCY
jgi:hypothetical protein